MGTSGALAAAAQRCEHGIESGAMKALGKRAVWAVGLLGATALVWFAPAAEPELVLRERSPAAALPVSASSSGSTSASRSPAARADQSMPKVLRLMARDGADASDESGSRLFATIDGNPAVEKNAAPVTPAIVAPRPQKKSAPPLPFTLLGRYDDQQRTAVYLQHGEQNLVVQVGDKIGVEYQVESLQGSSMVLRHLPSNERQTLDVGGAR